MLYWEKNVGPPISSRRSIKERLLESSQSEVRRAHWVCAYLAMSVPPPHPYLHKGGEHGSDGTLTRRSSGVKPIVEHGANYYACSFYEDCASTTPAVFVPSPSSPPLPTQGGASLAEPSSCHRPSVLEMAHLASSLVRPAGYVEAETPPSPNAVSSELRKGVTAINEIKNL